MTARFEPARSWRAMSMAALLLAACVRPINGQLGGEGNGADSKPPVSEADLQIAKRAQKILDSPSKWNRADNRKCPPETAIFSLYCALERATDEVTGNFQHREAVMQEARFVIEDISPKGKNYNHRLMDYNNDPSTSFTDIQRVLHLLEARIASRLKEEPARTKAPAAVSQSRPDTRGESSVTLVDLQIVQRAHELIDSELKWNRADNQDCPAGAIRLSIFCAFEKAAIDVKGDFDNRAAGIQEARSVISETAPNRDKYQARLTDFNNDPATTFSDVQNLFLPVEERLKRRLR